MPWLEIVNQALMVFKTRGWQVGSLKLVVITFSFCISSVMRAPRFLAAVSSFFEFPVEARFEVTAMELGAQSCEELEFGGFCSVLTVGEETKEPGLKSDFPQRRLLRFPLLSLSCRCSGSE